MRRSLCSRVDASARFAAPGRRSFASAAIALGCLMVLAAATGCPNPKSDGTDDGSKGTTTSQAAVPDKLTLAGVKPAADDVLMLGYNDDPDTLNAITSSDTVSEAFQRHVYETLANQSFKNPDEFEPALAESWEFDEENLEFTIHLRKGVMWHPIKLPSGKLLPPTEFTSRDVVFTFDCILNPHVEAAHIRSYFEDPDATGDDKSMITVRAVDKYTVKIRWKKPYFLAKDFTLAGTAIIPRHVYSVDENGEPISFDFRSKEFADGFNNHWANNMMCGTGPMMFKEWVPQQRLVLVRNPDYWGAPYYFSQIRYQCITNPNTMTQKLLGGELDFAGIPDKDQYLQCFENENVKAKKVKLVDYAYPGYRYIGYNMDRPVFQDKKFRWALAYATPVDRMVTEVFRRLATRTTGPFLPGSSAYNDQLPEIPFDLDKARELLAEAGWKDTDNDGIVDKTVGGTKIPARFELMIFSDAPSFRSIAEMFKEECRKIGVDVQVAPTKWQTMLQRLRKREYDAALLGWAMSWRQDPYQIWHSSQADLPDSSNHVAYRNPEVDKLIEQLRVTMDEEKQIELYHQIHKLIYDDQPYTFLFGEKATGGYNTRIRNVNFYKIRPCHDSREWFSDTPRPMPK